MTATGASHDLRLRPNAIALAGFAVCAVVALSGCDRSERDMLRQPKFKPDAPSALFPDGSATRAPVTGTVVRAMGDTAAVSSGRRGTREVIARQEAEAREALPERPSMQMLQRGRERYTIYCMPCHSPVGDGDGPVVERGFPHPPSYHIDRLRAAPDRHFYDVISRGYGLMYPYADRIDAPDRWAIVAYVRALQLSRHAAVAQLPADLQALRAASPNAPGTGEWRAVPGSAKGDR